MFIASQYNTHNNSLLSKVVRFLNSKDVSFETIHNLVNESTTAQLVPSFAFIGVWLSSNSNAETMRHSTFQVAYHLLHLISTKVPPIILLCGLQDLNWAAPNYHHHHSFVFCSFFERLQTIRSFVKPFAFAVENKTHLSRFSKCHSQIDSSLVNKYPGILMELYSDSNYQLDFMQHFKTMILNNTPINEFKDILCLSNSSIILTFAIIHLLHKFNNSRKLKHSQLLYYFSLIFRYINVFVASNNVNGLLITHQILNMPFVSPFLLIAMVNNIPKSLYIYNLLIPKRLTKGDLTVEEAKQAILDQFRIVDLSFDDELNRLIEYVPQYLFSFFLESSSSFEMPTDHPPDSIDNMLYMQLSNKTIPERFNTLVMKEIAQNQTIPPIEVISMGIQMDKFIINFVQLSISRGSFDKFLNSSFWSFFKDLQATVLPTVHDQFAPRLCQMIFKDASKDEIIPEMFISGILTTCMHVIIRIPYENNAIPFFLNCMKRNNEELQNLSRLIIMKIIQSDIVHISNEVVEMLKSSDDLVIILDYINALQNLNELNQFDDVKNLKGIISTMISKVPYTMTQAPVLTLSSLSSVTMPFNSVSNHINKIVGTYLSSNNVDLSRMLNQPNATNIHLLLRVLSSSIFIQKNESARAITEKTVSLLNSTNDNIIPKIKSFPVSSSMLVLPVAQHLLRQLLIFKHHDLAYVLIDAMSKPLLNDSIPLHWIIRFLSKNYDILTSDVKNTFDKITSSLPNADELYLSANKGYKIVDIIKLIQNTKVDYQQTPDVIKREYISSQKLNIIFSAVSILVRNDNVQTIVSEIVEPIYQQYLLNCSPSALYSFAMLLYYMPMSIILGIFTEVMKHRVFISALDILKYYLVFAPINIFKKICESATDFIKSDDIKLRSFMYIVIPSFCRLQQDEEVATKLLCGLLENVSPKTSRSLQENVIDVVGMIYVMLKLHKKRASLINSSKNFSPDLKAIIASSLDIEIDMPTTPNKPLVPKYMASSHF